MAKRFIDTEIFEDDWFMDLSVNAKLLYIYLFTKCDHAGLINLNFKLCEFQTGIIAIGNELATMNDRVIKVESEKNLYFLPKFFKRQYPNYPNDFKASKSAVKLLEKYGLWDEKNNRVTVNQQLDNSTEPEEPAAEEPAAEETPPEKINHIMEAVDTWNFFANAYDLSKVLKLTDARKAHVKNRLAESEFNLEAILRKVEKSEFLLGRSGNWKCSFDFIFGSKNNYVKILEGNYDGKNSGISEAQNKELDIIRENMFKDHQE